MPTTCAMKFCFNNDYNLNKKIAFFTFPKDPKISKEWALRCQIIPDYSKVLKVCEEHFKEEDIIYPLLPSGRKRLIRRAIPTIIFEENEVCEFAFKGIKSMSPCTMKLCRNRKNINGNISFFLFPTNERRFKEWAIRCCRPNLVYNKNLLVCEEHFEKKDIILPLLPYGRKRLSSRALPTMFFKPNSEYKISVSADKSKICEPELVMEVESPSKNPIQFDEKENDFLAITILEPQTISQQSDERREQRQSTITHDCSSGSQNLPCKHYVELIEEKARNYKLQRVNENLMDSTEDLQRKLQILETVMIDKGFDLDDIYVKLEVVEEEDS